METCLLPSSLVAPAWWSMGISEPSCILIDTTWSLLMGLRGVLGVLEAAFGNVVSDWMLSILIPLKLIPPGPGKTGSWAASFKAVVISATSAWSMENTIRWFGSLAILEGTSMEKLPLGGTVITPSLTVTSLEDRLGIPTCSWLVEME